MTLRRRLAGLVDVLLRRAFYGGPLRWFLGATGLESVAGDLYWRLQLALAGDVQTIAVGDAEASFRNRTRAEFRRTFQNVERERGRIERLIDDLEPDDVVWDVGASVGLYCCLIADVLDGGEVVCFEPNPANLEGLHWNVDRNELGDRVTIREEALADASGTTTMAVSSDAAGESAVLLDRDWMEREFEAEIARGDDLVDDGMVPRPDLVKIDVEGAELRVLRGMDRVLSSPGRRTVYCETHPGFLDDLGSSVGDVEAFLTDRGYELERIDGDIRAVKPAEDDR